MSGGSLLGKGLPYDAEIEYLESRSNHIQYIQLPLSVPKSSYFEVGGVIIGVHISRDRRDCIMSADPESQFRCAYYSYNSNSSSNTFSSKIGNSDSNGGWSAYIGQKTSFALSTTFIKINNVERALSRPLTGNITSLCIFTLSPGKTIGYPISFCELYIKVGDTKVYDLIPVRVGNVGYMYDKVSGQLFGNAGTGSFILGPDK